MKTSIIVPCYNEEKNIASLVKRFEPICAKRDVELVLVDNGSSDRTSEEIDLQRKEYPFVCKAVVEKNQGYGYGILKGLMAASGDFLGWMHADLQSDPEVFIPMIQSAEAEEGPFLYKGKRRKRPIVDVFFTFGMSIFETLYLHKFLWDINAQPTLLSRTYYEKWKQPPYDFSLDLYVYYYAKVLNVDIRRFSSVQSKRLNGTSTWNTGMQSRIKLIKRVLAYSKELKKSHIAGEI
jgi:glycosyltransferase involved in cell wall biosynthesis